MNSFQKILIGINAALIVAVVVLLILYTGKSTTTTLTKNSVNDTLDVETPVLPKAQGKIMFVNVDTFQLKYKYFKKIQTELEAIATANRGELERMQKKLVDTYNKYEKESNLMTELDMRNAQMDLAEQEKKIQQREEQLTEAYAKTAEKKNNDYLDRVKDYLRRKSDEHNYAYVLGYIRESNLLYAEDTLDITNLVVEGMNAEYDASLKK
jgi:outer membrane protein